MSISLTSPNGLINVQLGLYPDNTPVINFAEAWDANYGDIEAMVLRPASMQEFFTGMMICESIMERGGRVKNLIIPCIPGARQDRIKWEGDMLFTIKYVARAINDQNFDKVTTIDPHSMATTALIDRLHVYDQNHIFGRLMAYDTAPWNGVISPDQGAVKRAEAFSEVTKHWNRLEHGIPVFTASKHRDPATNKLSGFSVDGLEAGKHYLVVDDLCDAGGTFLGLAEKIHEAGATADLFVTHGLFTKGTEQLAKSFQRIYATDSTSLMHERVTYIKVTEGLI
jgi:ribose-phosphate pyrophosphokinase